MTEHPCRARGSDAVRAKQTYILFGVAGTTYAVRERSGAAHGDGRARHRGAERARVRRGRRVLARPGRAGHQPARAVRLRARRVEPPDPPAGRADSAAAASGCWPTRRESSSPSPDAAIRPPSDAIGGLSGNYLEGVATLGDRIVLILEYSRSRATVPDRRGVRRRGQSNVGKENDSWQSTAETETAPRADRSRSLLRDEASHITDVVSRIAQMTDQVSDGRRRAGAVARHRAERPQPDDGVAEGDGDAGRVRAPRRPTACCRRSTRSPRRSNR